MTTTRTERAEAVLPDTTFVSADSHVVEDPALWKDALDPAQWGELQSAFAGKPGAYDAAARVPEMAVDGVGAEVLYPSLAMKLFTLEPEPQTECFRRYNEWLADFCAVAPDQLSGGMIAR